MIGLLNPAVFTNVAAMGAAVLSGIVRQTLPGTDWAEVLVIKQQADGKLLVGGTADYGTFYPPPGSLASPTQFEHVLTRYNANGTLDETFGVGGTARVRVYSGATGPTDHELTDLYILASGEIVSAGQWYDGTTIKYVAVRFSSDGTVQTNWGETFGATLKAVSSSYVPTTRVAVQSTGRFVFCAIKLNSSIGRFFLFRLLPNGNTDRTFGPGGGVPVGENTFSDDATADIRGGNLYIGSDDKPIMLGVRTKADAGKAFLARSNVDGTAADTAFDTDGYLSYDSPDATGASASFALAVGSTKILVVGGGNHTSPAKQGLLLAQITLSDGSLDASFGAGGLQLPALSGIAGSSSDDPRAFAYDANGKPMVFGQSLDATGNWYTPTSLPLVARFTTAGVLDTTFDGDGFAAPTFDASGNQQVYTGIIQADGKLVFGGHCSGELVSEQGCLARLSTTGTVDTSFGQPSGWSANTSPSVTTDAADAITTTTATFHATVNPHGRATTVVWEYGPTRHFGFKTAGVSAGAGSVDTPVSLAVTGLLAGHTYYVRAAAYHPGTWDGTAYGATASFNTSAGATNRLLELRFTAADGTKPTTGDYRPEVNFTGHQLLQPLSPYNEGTITGNKLVSPIGGVLGQPIDIGINNSLIVEATFTAVTGSGGNWYAILLRYDTSGSEQYWAVVLDHSVFKIVERVSGSGITRATATQSLTNGAAYTVRVTCSGTTITATVNGANSISYGTYSSLSTFTKLGIEIDDAGGAVDNVLLDEVT